MGFSVAWVALMALSAQPSPGTGTELLDIEDVEAVTGISDVLAVAAITPLAASNQVLALVRDPAEDPPFTFRSMDLDDDGTPRDFFRDENWATTTFFQNPTDGDSWTVQALRPDGEIVAFDTLRWFETFGTQSNCFVFEASGASACNANAIFVLWFARAQCEPPGDWLVRYFYNNAQFDQRPFRMYPRIPRLKPDGSRSVVAFNQGDYDQPSGFPQPYNVDHHYDRSCRYYGIDDLFVRCTEEPPNLLVQRGTPIRTRGCYMTAIAQMLTYYYNGSTVDPVILNRWGRVLRNRCVSGSCEESADTCLTDADCPGTRQDLYRGWGIVESPRIGVFTSELGGPIVHFETDAPFTTEDDIGIDLRICEDGPQILQVEEHHFITALGREGSLASPLIYSDPDGGLADNADERKLIDARFPTKQYTAPLGWRFYAGPASPEFASPGTISISVILAESEFVPSPTAPLRAAQTAAALRTPVRLLVTDGRGRRVGTNASGQSFNEIPRAMAYTDGLRNDETKTSGSPLWETVSVAGPADGTYTLTVFATADTRYDIDIDTHRSNLTSQGLERLEIPLAAGASHLYAISYGSTAGAPIAFGGGFDGGGSGPPTSTSSSRTSTHPKVERPCPPEQQAST